jgi:hypothetical protein
MRFSSLPYALPLGLGLAVACTNDPGQTTIFDPTNATGDAESTSAGEEDVTTAEPETSTSTSTTSGDETTDDDDSDTNQGSVCGDGIVSGNEECDCGGGACTPEGLDNKTCVDVTDPLKPGILTGGTLGCNPASCRFNTSECTYCGDGEVNGIEECEPGLPIDLTCEALGAGTGGQLTCNDTTCTADTSMCTDCGYTFNFESCANWTTGKAHASGNDVSWACGNPTGTPPNGPPGNPTGVWATNLTGTYNFSESSFLQSPPLNLTSCAGEGITMTLRHWYLFEGGVTRPDGGIVQISTNGTTWTTIDPVGGALYGAGNIGATYPPVMGTPGFNGNQNNNSNVMLESMWDLSAYAGLSDVHLRFVFGSDSSDQRAGWYLDNLELLGTGG